ncbi:MAG: hypothetical protein UR34_C0003G0029 [candidate division WS6 bacterium GW2011_GWC1_33_20]|uniref:Fimbrial assembly family protein n=2 Tax=Candidatus Dojkabacteria TaxID=74243 RepID=A0A0G0CWQ2_9BACT|nr:MAG: hypothetical protein UR32_C0003G0016 [candidate division WS6 bacterium GW2011_GWE2_33_157]KKP44403.1 MAG: hypothetical protein UR34_C0003G0029 [candidate division WS6 bacterium GW2011_GWC1_33_20]KKP55455.1 MAG: hypothetical protein UR47_C0001G0016 [candidate division WS6 bacterium GW2011_GWB1_33_6]KKP55534.1 MAG: hypothetical protein UR45_C0001G0016 [candidate division WS6 bacterium GW2011_WS6_33_547]KKP56902.1 MAG: hypothetical protein UR49_C0006G0029 [candidate division WS6 bacterium 
MEEKTVSKTEGVVQNTPPVQASTTVSGAVSTQPVQPKIPGKPTLAQPKATPVEEGVNLIPAMTEEEKVSVKTKNTLNVGSILSLIALATIAIGIVGFNILSKTQLNSKKADLARIEGTVKSKMDKIVANNAIVDRAILYSEVKENSFSHKKIIEFFNSIGARIGSVSFKSIDISETLEFELSGSTVNLEQTAKLWYLFGVHENIDTINLESVSKSENGATFSFKGVLNIKNFTNE